MEGTQPEQGLKGSHRRAAAFQTLLGLSTVHLPISYRQMIDEAA